MFGRGVDRRQHSVGRHPAQQPQAGDARPGADLDHRGRAQVAASIRNAAPVLAPTGVAPRRSPLARASRAGRPGDELGIDPARQPLTCHGRHPTLPRHRPPVGGRCDWASSCRGAGGIDGPLPAFFQRTRNDRLDAFVGPDVRDRKVTRDHHCHVAGRHTGLDAAHLGVGCARALAAGLPLGVPAHGQPARCRGPHPRRLLRVFRSLETYTPGPSRAGCTDHDECLPRPVRRKQRIRIDALGEDAEARLRSAEPGPEQAYEQTHFDDDVQRAPRRPVAGVPRRSRPQTSRASPTRRSPPPWGLRSARSDLASTGAAPPAA